LAALAGEPEGGNPHAPGTAQARNWRDGWRTRTEPTPITAKKPAREKVGHEKAGRAGKTSHSERIASMDLVEKLPSMADDALATLAANAVRLAQVGTPKQQAAAKALLPAVEAEVASRRVEKPVRATRAKKKAS
jgi:hypothetical protein